MNRLTTISLAASAASVALVLAASPVSAVGQDHFVLEG